MSDEVKPKRFAAERMQVPALRLDEPRSKIRDAQNGDARSLHLEASKVLLGYVRSLDLKTFLDGDDLAFLRGVLIETGNVLTSANAVGLALERQENERVAPEVSDAGADEPDAEAE